MATTSRAAPVIDIVQAVRDPSLIGDELSVVQEALLRSIYGLDVPDEQVPIVEKCTGHAPRVGVEYREIAVVAGRRSGKSDKIASNICLYEALIRQHRLSPGENGTVLLLARDQRQARVVRGYIEAKLTRSPILSQYIDTMRGDEIVLKNNVVIAIYPASFRSIRGLSVITAVLDEVAFWPVDENYASPDAEVLKALRPATATHERAKIVLVSSPYSRDGILWQMFANRDNDPDTLVWHSETQAMNPSVSTKFLEKERARDLDAYRREYLAEFTDAISAFIPGEAIESCVVRGRTEVPYGGQSGHVGAIDSAFRGDSFTFCIAHRTDDVITIDHLVGWQGTREHPVKLGDILPQIKRLTDRYRIYSIVGDQYGAEPLKHVFNSVGLTLEEVPFTQSSKADVLGNLRSLVVEGKIELLDHERSIKEIRALEVEALPGGASRVGHPRRTGAHDDFAVAIALAAWETRQASRGTMRPITNVDDIVVGSRSVFLSDVYVDGLDHPGEQIVGRMNDRGGFDRVGGW